jgi:hydrogenase maturation protease
MKRIICIGNRYVPSDAAGFRVYQQLRDRALPPDVELVDGGLAGLDLLRWVEHVERVVFVDSLDDPETNAPIVVLSAGQVATLASGRFEHAAGLPYLLRVLPEVCDGPLPEIWLVGVDSGASAVAIQQAASLALALAGEGDAALCSTGA